MAGLPTDEHAPEPDSAIEDTSPCEDSPAAATAGSHDDERPPAPALWAAALALLALLAFGVLIGSLTGSGSREPERVVLAAAPSRASAQAAIPPASDSGKGSHGDQAEAGEGEEGSAGEQEAGEEGGQEGSEEGGEGAAGAKAADGEGKGKARSPGSLKHSPASSPGQQPAAAGQVPPIKHVFLIVLADQGFEEGFGASAKAPYLAKHLRGEGELIDNYYAATSGELANEIALISGQGPTPQTAAGCPLYEELIPGKIGPEGQALGSGCVYPGKALTIGDQLAAAGRTWKAYVQGLAASGGCAVPSLGTADPHAVPTPASPYVTWRDPFAYFRSVTGSPSCADHLVALQALRSDLRSAAHTPSLSYIAPDPCDDGSAEPCAPGQPAGMQAAEPFLHKVVPEIEASPAYREGGLIAITFDQAPQSGPHADSSGCCMSTAYPNLAAVAPAASTGTTSFTTTTGTASTGASGTSTSTTTAVAQTTSAGTSTTMSTSASGTTAGAGTSVSASATTTATTTGTTTPAGTGAGAGTPAARPGGGRVGLLLISRYVKPGSVEVVGDYNHFSLLLSIESIFKLHPLGYAGAPGLLDLGSSVYNGQP